MTTDWKDPFWFVSETLRVLSEGVPGGFPIVILGMLVVLSGVASYVRQSPAVAAVMLLPAGLMAAVLLTLEHNLWPRFFFFAAGFAVLVAIRGAVTATELILRARGRVLAVAALALLVLASAATLPAAYQPKQDYAAARAFVEQNRAAGDAVVSVDMSNYVYEKYDTFDFIGVSSEAELQAIERSHERTWFLYTFPTRLAAVQPGIWARLQNQYRSAAEFSGSVGGGNIVVKVKP
jgi:hypothetical protein